MKYIAQKEIVKTVVGVDVNKDLKGKSPYELDGNLSKNTTIFYLVKKALNSITEKLNFLKKIKYKV